ncbi:MAG: alpha/beta hydrolase [Deltaproteobacteria bacterium]|nr:alpha/beta hydrolase [Deltaproteobacteria bacterium]
MVTEAKFDTGEVKLHYAERIDDAPSGAPLVLLHGTSTSWLRWVLVLDAIGSGRRLFALDARGHGRSGRVPNGYRYIDYPRDQQAFLRAVVREPAVRVGSSLGGLNAIYIAAETPELVRALVLVDPPLYKNETGPAAFGSMFRAFKELAESDLTAGEISERLAGQVPELPLEFAPALAQFLVWLDPQTPGQVLDGSAFGSWRSDELPERITCPLQLLVGEAALGGALETTEVERAEKKLANCQTVFMNDAGHNPHVEQPEAFSRTVRQFLEAL